MDERGEREFLVGEGEQTGGHIDEKKSRICCWRRRSKIRISMEETCDLLIEKDNFFMEEKLKETEDLSLLVRGRNN